MKSQSTKIDLNQGKNQEKSGKIWKNLEKSGKIEKIKQKHPPKINKMKQKIEKNQEKK